MRAMECSFLTMVRKTLYCVHVYMLYLSSHCRQVCLHLTVLFVVFFNLFGVPGSSLSSFAFFHPVCSLHPSLVSLAMLSLGGVVFLPDVCCCPVRVCLLVTQ